MTWRSSQELIKAMEDKTNREPEGIGMPRTMLMQPSLLRQKKETERMDAPCPNSCLPCEETVNKSHNSNMHKASCHEAGNSCVLCGRTSRAESDLKGHNVSQHTEDCIGSYKILKGRCWLDKHIRTSHVIRKKTEDCQHCEYKF